MKRIGILQLLFSIFQSRRLIAGFLVLLGLSRVGQYYMGHGLGAYRWFMGPLAHVFVTESRLQQLKLEAEFQDGKKQTFQFGPGQFKNDNSYGFFIRHAIVSVMTSSGPHSLFPGLKIWRQAYWCGKIQPSYYGYGTNLPRVVRFMRMPTGVSEYVSQLEITCVH